MKSLAAAPPAGDAQRRCWMLYMHPQGNSQCRLYNGHSGDHDFGFEQDGLSLRDALAEGLHSAMCFGPTTLHNRLACERPAVYLAIADAALTHPAMRAFTDSERSE